MSPVIYILTIMVLPVTAVIVFAMKYASSYAAARANLAAGSELRSLLAKNADAVSTIGASMKLIADEQARQARTLATVESILKAVG
jgi:hypothetical protein